MVVHDMRNPTNQIEYSLTQSLHVFKEIQNQLKDLDMQFKSLTNNFNFKKAQSVQLENQEENKIQDIDSNQIQENFSAKFLKLNQNMD